MLVTARAGDHKGNVIAAIDDVDDELGIRPHWRKVELSAEQRAAVVRGNVIRVKREGVNGGAR